MLAGLGLAFPRVFTTEAEAQPILNLSPMLPEGTRSEAILDTLPGKKPLIKLSYRPPNYESPIGYLGTVITPNDAFFLRSTPGRGTWLLAATEQMARSGSP